MTEALSVIEEIRRGFENISDVDLHRAQRQLGPIQSHERALGTVHNLDARKLWALALAYEAESARFASEAKYMANTEVEAAEARRRSTRAAAYESLARELFWLQVKEDIGGVSWVAEGGIAVRDSWLIVALPKGPIHGVIERLIGGA